MIIEKADRLNDTKELYFSTKLQEIRKLNASGKDIINIGIGSPDLAPPTEVITAISQAVLQEDKHSYQAYQGLQEFREAVSYFYSKHFSVTVNPENEILPFLGSKEGIVQISLAFLNKDDEVLIPNPAYASYTSATKMLEAKPLFYNLTEENDWFPDLDKLEKQDLSKVKIMWLNYPSMPVGKIATKEQFKKLISFAKKNKILLINDNPYSFILNEKPLSILSIEGAKEVALELNSLSKTFNMAGWRVGMLLGDKEYLKPIFKIKTNIDNGIFYGIQKGAIAALKSHDEWFKKLNAIYKERRKIVWQILDKLNCKYNKNFVGMFVWAKIPNKKLAKEFTDDLLYEKNIFISPGTIFGTNGEGYVRVSLCVNKERLIEALNRI